MSIRLMVNGLSSSTSEDTLRDIFLEFGRVIKVEIVTDRDTGRSRGFGFVTMKDGGQRAMEELDCFELDGKRLHFSEMREGERPIPYRG